MRDILQVTENGRLKLKEDHPYYYQVKINLQSSIMSKKPLIKIYNFVVFLPCDTDILVVRRFVAYLLPAHGWILLCNKHYLDITLE
jgi:hypothetical protein